MRCGPADSRVSRSGEATTDRLRSHRLVADPNLAIPVIAAARIAHPETKLLGQPQQLGNTARISRRTNADAEAQDVGLLDRVIALLRRLLEMGQSGCLAQPRRR